jgi:RNA polymerase sigma-70 factor, ECF subfamily
MSASVNASASGPTNGSEPTDAELIAAVAERDRAAFGLLFDRYAVRIKAFMLRTGAAEADADEIAQDVMVSIWRRAASFDPARAAPSTWIFAIARNRRIDLVRRMRRPAPDPADPLFQPDPAPDAMAGVSLAEREAMVRESLKSLAPEQLEVLRLAFYDGLSHGEIAERSGLPLGTVKSRIRLAFRHLRAALGDGIAAEIVDD